MWKDVTGYSRGDQERKPTTFEAQVGALRVVVTCGHVIYRPKWVMFCPTLAIDAHMLGNSGTKEQAEAEAIAVVLERLADLTKCAKKLAPRKAKGTKRAAGAAKAEVPTSVPAQPQPSADDNTQEA